MSRRYKESDTGSEAIMQNKPPSPDLVRHCIGRIPRCPGFRYGPKIIAARYNGAFVYRVEQKGFWMDAAIVGPTKHTKEEAVKAWKRLLKAKHPRAAPCFNHGGSPPGKPPDLRNEVKCPKCSASNTKHCRCHGEAVADCICKPCLIGTQV